MSVMQRVSTIDKRTKRRRKAVSWGERGGAIDYGLSPILDSIL
jgi:hypothetical protein